MDKVAETVKSVGEKINAAVSDASKHADASKPADTSKPADASKHTDTSKPAAAGGEASPLQSLLSAAEGGAGGGGGGKLANMMSGGMPCSYELLMEFVIGFLFTFLVYFLVFGFVPYHDIVSTMTKFVIEFPEKMYNSFLGKMPSSAKNAKSGSILSNINNFFSKTIPDMIKKEKEKMLTPLQKKLKNLKDKEHSKTKNSNPVSKYITDVKIKIMTIWEKLKHSIIPAIFVSLIYYVVWIIIFKFIPQIMKYGINMAMSFK